MTPILDWRVLLGLVVAYYASLAFYRLSLHPLARIPGPRLAAISRWYEGYYDVVLPGQYTKRISELHKTYGPIIRISPWELHVSDPAFFDTIYRNDGRWDKYAWAYDAFGAPNSTVFSSAHNVHKAHRRAIAPFFSKPNVLARQDLLYSNVEKLCKRLTKHIGTIVDFGAAISAFTRDNANEYILDKAYNELDQEDFGVGLSVVSSGAGSFWRVTKFVPWFGPTLKAIPMDWMMRIADEGTKAFLGRIKQSEEDTREIMTAAEKSPSADKTMIGAILNSDLSPADKTFERVMEEVSTVSGAASETAANTLKLIFFHIYSNNSILERLRSELGSVPLTVKTLEQLPYLTATLMEGLRLSPGIASRMARITDRDLFYNEQRIPAGTPVGMTLILMHTDGSIYPDPMKFNPDRWVDERASTSKFAPFSKGTRMCVGMHLAWAELYLLVAAVVQRFDLTIKDLVASDYEMECDNFGIGTKAGCHLRTVVQVR